MQKTHIYYIQRIKSVFILNLNYAVLVKRFRKLMQFTILEILKQNTNHLRL